MWSQVSISNLNVSIWGTDPGIEQMDEVKPVASTAVDRVRSVDGMKWMVPLYKGLLRARLANGDHQQITLIRISAASIAINAVGSWNASLPGFSGNAAY